MGKTKPSKVALGWFRVENKTNTEIQNLFNAAIERG